MEVLTEILHEPPMLMLIAAVDVAVDADDVAVPVPCDIWSMM